MLHTKLIDNINLGIKLMFYFNKVISCSLHLMLTFQTIVYHTIDSLN